MSIPLPFTILIDTAETHPWTFAGMKSDADRQYREWKIEPRYQALGRHPDSNGDYSLVSSAGDSYVGEVGIERKSVDDLIGTLLGWPREYVKQGITHEETGRRERFESELANLTGFSACVIVEGSLGAVLTAAYATPGKTQEVNRRILNRSIIAYVQDYSVPWIFADSRRLAEAEAFRWLFRFYEKRVKKVSSKSKKARG